jgi:hypothetical protein
MENWNPIGGAAGESYMVQGAMIPTEKAGQQQAAAAPPAPKAEVTLADILAGTGNQQAQLSAALDRVAERVDELGHRSQPITVTAPNVDVNLTLDQTGKPTRKLVTMHHGENGKTTAEIVETPEGKD